MGLWESPLPIHVHGGGGCNNTRDKHRALWMQHCQHHSMPFNVSMSFTIITHCDKIVLLTAASITVNVAATTSK